MKHIPSVILVSLALSACGGSDNSAVTVGSTSGETPSIDSAYRVVNGISDSNTLTASIANVANSSENIAFGTAGNLIINIADGTYTVQLTPSDASQAFSVNNVDIGADYVTTLFTAGLLGKGTQSGFAIQESLAAPSEGQAIVQIVNAALLAAPYQISVGFMPLSEDGIGIGGGSPAYGQSSSVNLPAGRYEIIVSFAAVCPNGPNGFCDEIAGTLFDSGHAGVTILPNNIFQLVLLDKINGQLGGGDSPISLLVLDGAGDSTALFNEQH